MYEQIQQSVEFLEARNRTPDIALVLGSGLGPLAEELENRVAIPFGDLHISAAPQPPTTPENWCSAHLPEKPSFVCRDVFTVMRAIHQQVFPIPFRCSKPWAQKL